MTSYPLVFDKPPPSHRDLRELRRNLGTVYTDFIANAAQQLRHATPQDPTELDVRNYSFDSLSKTILSRAMQNHQRTRILVLRAQAMVRHQLLIESAFLVQGILKVVDFILATTCDKDGITTINPDPRPISSHLKRIHMPAKIDFEGRLVYEEVPWKENTLSSTYQVLHEIYQIMIKCKLRETPLEGMHQEFKKEITTQISAR